MMNDKKFDWVVVGGGIGGVAIAEILCREGKSVLLVEKNSQVGSETTKVFHEWLHTGALYSLVPDNLATTRYLLGAMDDLFAFYHDFSRMNLCQSENGILINNSGWFNDDAIEYRYRVRKLNPVWMSMVSRSVNVSNLIKSHDWLRRSAGGSEFTSKKVKVKNLFDLIDKQIQSKSKFFSIDSPDFTMNSRVLMGDLLSAAFHNGLEVITSEAVTNINQTNSIAHVETTSETFEADNVVICSPDVISNTYNIPITTGYAPMAVVENIPEEERSFVELDYYTKSCINLLKKEDGIGLAGGITVEKTSQITPYLNYVIKEHKKRNPGIKVLDTYVGVKRELVQSKEKRNYLYHITQHNPNVWSVVLGKFTLAFSMGPEFFRRVYHRNPTRSLDQNIPASNLNILSKTAWKEIADKKGKI